MNKSDEKNERGTGLRFLGMLAPVLPSLSFRLLAVYLRFKGTARKGSRIFQQELRNQGLDEEIAKKLTRIYLNSSNIIQYFR